MKIVRFVALWGFIVLIAGQGVEASYTLQDVINANEAVANFTPSHLSAPVGGKPIIIQGRTYELRFFIFEQKGVPQADLPKFRDFITEWQQLSLTPKQRPEALVPTDYFTSTPEMKEKGYYFLLALREVTSPQLLNQLKAREE